MEHAISMNKKIKNVALCFKSPIAKEEIIKQSETCSYIYTDLNVAYYNTSPVN